jgi:hypothetical protein
MARRILVCLLILSVLPLYSQSSPKPENDYTHCFTDTEWAAFEEEVWQEEQASIVEAVNEAVKPYLISVQELNRELAAMETSRNWWRVGTFAGIGAGLILALVVALAR